jgi:hypothetical protein
MTAGSTDMLAYALSYASRGLTVIPLHTSYDGRCSCGKADCDSIAKHPRIKGWNDHATTEGDIRQWWQKWPDANIGIRTGRVSNQFVIDVDGEDGFRTLEEMKAAHGWQPKTLTAKTGRGIHLYFRVPDQEVHNSKKKLGAGIDVRGEGGYVVAPPSAHASGSSYAWLNADKSPEEAPAWLLEALAGPRVVTDTADTGSLINEGSRNDTLFKKGCSLRRRGFEIEEIEEELMRMNTDECNPPLEESEVRTIAKSAAKYEVNERVSPVDVAGVRRGKNSPLFWFQFNNNTWRANQLVSLMTDYQRGWYVSLLVECWQTGGFLPNDTIKLAKLAKADSAKKFQKEKGAVLAEFEPTPDGCFLVLPEMRDEWNQKYKVAQAKGKGGQASRAARQRKPEKDAA